MQQEAYKILNEFWMYIDKLDAGDLKNKRSYNDKQTELIKQLVKNSAAEVVVLDIGANIGYFTLLMAKQESVKKVYAFEPDPSNFNILTRNIRLNRLTDKIEAYQVAVTNNANSKVRLHLCNFNTGMHRIYPSKWCKGGRQIKVKSCRLDNLLLNKEKKINFIKMDVEGSELGALKGMEQILKRDKPVMMMEFHVPSILEYGVDPKEVYDFLVNNIGYRNITLFANHKDDNYNDIENITFEELVEITETHTGRNILCR